MAMVLHCDAQYFEGMHSDCHVLYALLILEDEVYRTGEHIHKGVAIRSGQEDLP